MLSIILAAQRTQFTALAEFWLAEGATTFSIWENGQMLAQWPAEAKPHETQTNVPIQVGMRTLGELRVSGLNGVKARTRLTVEADLIGQLVKAENEMDNLTAELVDAQDQLLALYELNRATRTHLEIDQMLYLLTQEVVRLVKAEGVFIMLNTNDQPMFVEQHPVALFDEIALQYFFKHSLASGYEELLLRIEDAPDMLPNEMSSLFLKPTPIRKNTTALLGFLLNQPAVSLSPNLKLARAITDYVGAQIENSLLHQETLEQAKLKTELELAAQIQLRLLPQRLPKVSGLDVAAMSRPASQVGGDFYDFVGQPGLPFTFIIGDVSGKGMSAALLMAMTRTVIRSKANSQPMPTPEAVLAYSNEIMYDDFTEVGMFATVFVGRYDPTPRELLYANAGHSPVIYCPGGTQAQLLEADGPAMGVLQSSLSEDCVITFSPGDLLILATDGFSEARNPAGEMFGFEQLLQLVESLAHKSAREIVGAMFDAIAEFSDEHVQDDDQTLVVIKGVET